MLANNAEHTPQPGLVNSREIAGKLGISLSETRDILKTMQMMGIAQSNMDTDYSLITPHGMSQLNS